MAMMMTKTTRMTVYGDCVVVAGLGRGRRQRISRKRGESRLKGCCSKSLTRWRQTTVPRLGSRRSWSEKSKGR
jgi:hypothetical protein